MKQALMQNLSEDETNTDFSVQMDKTGMTGLSGNMQAGLDTSGDRKDKEPKVQGNRQNELADESPEIETRMPQRGGNGPVRICELLEPIGQIIRHPDRDRLMAEFFKDYR